jgi:dTDP-4-dehydrorhamnose reductase
VKVLVFGASGMAGHVVSLYLREQGHTVDTVGGRNRLDDSTTLLDITDQAALRSFLESAPEYDAVVNCIGLLIQQSGSRPDLAAYVNGYFPHVLERHYHDASTRLIHLSTDCVYSGYNAPYREDSPYDGESFYDRSKALGEIRNEKDLTFRMSIIGPDLSPNGVGLFNWFYAQSGRINGFDKAIWNGITTIELARGINAALAQGLTGLYHLVPDSNISKFSLLEIFRDVFNRTDISIDRDSRYAVDKTLINTRTDFDFTVPAYPAMIEEMRTWISSHAELYPHYRMR